MKLKALSNTQTYKLTFLRKLVRGEVTTQFPHVIFLHRNAALQMLTWKKNFLGLLRMSLLCPNLSSSLATRRFANTTICCCLQQPLPYDNLMIANRKWKYTRMMLARPILRLRIRCALQASSTRHVLCFCMHMYMGAQP